MMKECTLDLALYRLHNMQRFEIMGCYVIKTRVILSIKVHCKVHVGPFECTNLLVLKQIGNVSDIYLNGIWYHFSQSTQVMRNKMLLNIVECRSLPTLSPLEKKHSMWALFHKTVGPINVDECSKSLKYGGIWLIKSWICQIQTKPCQTSYQITYPYGLPSSPSPIGCGMVTVITSSQGHSHEEENINFTWYRPSVRSKSV